MYSIISLQNCCIHLLLAFQIGSIGQLLDLVVMWNWEWPV